MVPLLEAHRAAIIALCRCFGVARLEVFRSAARSSDFDPERSDVDLLVTWQPGHTATTLRPGAPACWCAPR